MADSSIHLSEAAAKFLTSRSADGVKQNTLSTYAPVFNALRDALGDPPLRDITADDIDALVVQLRREYKPSSVFLKWAKLRAFFRWCVERHYIDASPALVKVRAPQPDPLRNLAYDDAEISRLLAACADDVQLTAIVRFLLDTGARASELCSVRLDALDLDAGTCAVMGKVSRPGTLYFTDVTADALRRWLDARDVDHDHVFVSAYGTPLKRRTLNRMLLLLGEAAGVEAVRPHRFRHTTGRRFALAGAPLAVSMAKLRHSSPQMTTRYYSNTDANDLRRFTDQVGGAP